CSRAPSSYSFGCDYW
nr:immunoglobulin heavy chain junction region [Macaca mulatta]